MRILFFLLITATAFCQKTRQFPFQVFSAKNCTSKKNEVVKNFDFLKSSEILTIKAGEAYLIHHTGLSFHFKGDTVISISKLNKLLDHVPSLGRPNLKEIFSENSFTRAIHDSDPKIIYPPPIHRIIHNRQSELCLQWKPEKGGLYRIVIENLFGDSIASFTTIEPNFKISPTQIPTTKLDLDILLIKIEYSDKKLNSDQELIKLVNNNLAKPFPCEFENALQALLVGYWLDDLNLKQEAEVFYKTAASMTSNPMFQEAYSYYLKRKARYTKK